MSYTDIFGGTAVRPTDTGLQELAVSANAALYWPHAAVENASLAAPVVYIASSTAGGFVLTLPDARQASEGTGLLFVNPSANSVTVNSNSGSNLGTVGAGVAKYFLLIDNSSAGGSWSITTFGTGSSAAEATALAGAGLIASVGLLAQGITRDAKAASYTVASTDRAKLLDYTGGPYTLTLPTSGTMLNGFFFFARNSSSGSITVAASGADTVDGAGSFALAPGESAILFSGGASNVWKTVGFGRSSVFAFTQLTKNVAGSSDVTLTTTEAASKLLVLTGALTGNINVIVPSAANVYYVANSTSGSFTLTVKTAAGTGVAVTQGARDILTCDSTNVSRAVTLVGSTTEFGAGSAAAPSITFTGDTNTGIFKPGADQMAVATAGAQVANFTSAGLDLTGNINASGNATVAGLTATAQRVFSGTISPSISASQNDWSPSGFATCARIFFSVDFPTWFVTGMLAGTAGREIELVSNPANTGILTITSESASSTAANRFTLPPGLTHLIIPPGGAARFWYNGTTSRWNLASTSFDPNRVLISSVDLTGVDSTQICTFTTGIDTSYATRGVRRYVMEIEFTLAGNQATEPITTLYLHFSTNGGSSWDDAGTTYDNQLFLGNLTNDIEDAQDVSGVQLFPSNGVEMGQFFGTVTFSTVLQMYHWHTAHSSTLASGGRLGFGAGKYTGSAPNAVRLSMNDDRPPTGQVRLYACR